MSDTRYCPECGQTGSGPYCHHWDAGTERKIATLVRPPDLMAALKCSLGIHDWQDAGGDCDQRFICTHCNAVKIEPCGAHGGP